MGLNLTALLVMGAAQAVEGDTTPSFGTAAGSANPSDVGAVRRNPAAMLLEVDYTSQIDFAFGQGPRLTTTVRDTRTSAFGAGAMVTQHWAQRTPDPESMPGWTLPGEEIVDESRDGSYRISFGYGFFPQSEMTAAGPVQMRRFSIGASVAYERWTGTLSGLTTGWALDLSVAGRPTQSLVLAATARDLLTPVGLRRPSYDLGLWWFATPWLNLGAEGGYDPNVGPLVTHGGADILLSNLFSIRGGYGVEGKRQFLAGGVGIAADDDRARIDYGIRWDTAGPDTGALEHSIGLYATF